MSIQSNALKTVVVAGTDLKLCRATVRDPSASRPNDRKLFVYCLSPDPNTAYNDLSKAHEDYDSYVQEVVEVGAQRTTNVNSRTFCINSHSVPRIAGSKHIRASLSYVRALIRSAFEAGFEHSGEGYNGEYPGMREVRHQDLYHDAMGDAVDRAVSGIEEVEV